MPRCLAWLLLSLSPLLLAASSRRSRQALLRAFLPPRTEPSTKPNAGGRRGLQRRDGAASPLKEPDVR